MSLPIDRPARATPRPRATAALPRARAPWTNTDIGDPLFEGGNSHHSRLGPAAGRIGDAVLSLVTHTHPGGPVKRDPRFVRRLLDVHGLVLGRRLVRRVHD